MMKYNRERSTKVTLSLDEVKDILFKGFDDKILSKLILSYNHEVYPVLKIDGRDISDEENQKIEDHLKSILENGIIPPQAQSISIESSIKDLDISVRCINCLMAAEIDTIRDLVCLTMNDLLKITNLGKRSAEEIRSSLEEKGLSLSKT